MCPRPQDHKIGLVLKAPTPTFACPQKKAIAVEHFVQGQHGLEKWKNHWLYPVIYGFWSRVCSLGFMVCYFIVLVESEAHKEQLCAAIGNGKPWPCGRKTRGLPRSFTCIVHQYWLWIGSISSHGIRAPTVDQREGFGTLGFVMATLNEYDNWFCGHPPTTGTMQLQPGFYSFNMIQQPGHTSPPISWDDCVFRGRNQQLVMMVWRHWWPGQHGGCNIWLRG